MSREIQQSEKDVKRLFTALDRINNPDAIPYAQAEIPKKQLIPNNKLTNQLYAVGRIQSGETICVDVSYPVEKTPVNTFCLVEYDESKVMMDAGLTEYDRNVYNAITSIFVSSGGPVFITPSMIYRTITGTDASPDASLLEPIVESINKMSLMRVSIDLTDEIKKHYSKEDLSGVAGKYETYLLNTSKMMVQCGGYHIDGFRIEKVPVLFEYSSLSRQILTIPIECYDIREVKDGMITKKRIRNTESRIRVKGYLLRRIEILRGDNNMCVNRILFDSYDRDGVHHPGIYEIAGCENESRSVKYSLREYVRQLLDYWVALGILNSYEFDNCRPVSSLSVYF